MRMWRTPAGTLLVERPAEKMHGYAFDGDGIQIEDVSTYVELDDTGKIINRYRASSCSLDDYLYSSAFSVAADTLYKYSTSHNTPRSEVRNEATAQLKGLTLIAEDELPDAMHAAIEALERSHHDEAAEQGSRWTWWSK